MLNFLLGLMFLRKILQHYRSLDACIMCLCMYASSYFVKFMTVCSDVLRIWFLQGTSVNIIVGSHVWVEDQQLAWVDGQVSVINGEVAEIRTFNGKKVCRLLFVFLWEWYVDYLCCQYHNSWILLCGVWACICPCDWTSVFIMVDVLKF